MFNFILFAFSFYSISFHELVGQEFLNQKIENENERNYIEYKRNLLKELFGFKEDDSLIGA